MEGRVEAYNGICEGRYQRLSYDGHLSDPLPFTFGVPKGSIVCPLLFIMFMSDLILEVETHVLKCMLTQLCEQQMILLRVSIIP